MMGGGCFTADFRRFAHPLEIMMMGVLVDPVFAKAFSPFPIHPWPAIEISSRRIASGR